jgi:Flp pilus assembly protein TadG
MAPWIFFLFVGILDVGFYCYALIAVQNAARVAAIAVSGSQLTAADIAYANTYACAAAVKELEMMPNMVGVTTCSGDGNTLTQALPIAVATRYCPGGVVTPAGATMPACSGTDPYWEADVKYQTVPLIPIPGLLTNQLDIIRNTQVKQGT